MARQEVHSHHIQSIERDIALPTGFDMVAKKDPTCAGRRGITHDARTHRFAIAGFHEKAFDVPSALLLRRLRNSDGEQRGQQRKRSPPINERGRQLRRRVPVSICIESRIFAPPFQDGTRSLAVSESANILRRRSAVRSSIPRLWAHEALDSVRHKINVCLA